LVHGAIDGGNGIANWLVVSDYLREWLSTKTRHGDQPRFSSRRLTDFLYWNGRRPRNRNLNKSGILAAKQATKTIPIVFASSGDPVKGGLVASYTRPGGNVTGFTILGAGLEAKRLQILKQVVPGLSRVAVMWNSANPAILAYYEQTVAAAAVLKLTLQTVVEVRRVDDFARAFSTVGGARADALVVLADRFLLAHRKEIVAFAATSRLPGMYPYREYVNAGGLLSYAPSDIDQFRRTAIYVDKILRGAKIANLPVQDPIKYEFVINLNTAKALGLEIPFNIQQLADEMIE
jgi:putative ABC transport system substrate-binding protein